MSLLQDRAMDHHLAAEVHVGPIPGTRHMLLLVLKHRLEAVRPIADECERVPCAGTIVSWVAR
jgi:hypothetical protein